jgi:glyoxylase-like metal-dependent hydrolase (beta-lactamase superfamily II)
MKLFAIDGNTQKLDGGAMYGNAPRAVWEAWSPPDEKNRIDLACRALLVVTDDGKRILFEAGIGAFFEPKLRERFGVVESEHLLLKNLAAVGVAPEAIDTVVLSHLHFDHAGGVLSAWGDGEPRLVFPNAKYYVGRTHWERARHPHSRDRASFIPVLNQLLADSGRLVLVGDDGESDLAPLVRFRFSNGHTVGLMLAEVRLAGGPLVFVADLIPGLPWVHAPITMGYDRYPELLIDEKTKLLDELVGESGKIFFTHDPSSACGVVVRDDKGRFSAKAIEVASLG